MYSNAMSQNARSRSHRSQNVVAAPGSRVPVFEGSVAGHFAAFAGVAVAAVAAASAPAVVAGAAVVVAAVVAAVRVARRRPRPGDDPPDRREGEGRRGHVAAD